MRTGNRRDTGKQVLRWLIGGMIGVAFVFALIVSARVGTNAAFAQLPESVRLGTDQGPPIGVEVLIGTDGEPVFLSPTKTALRDFFFRHPSLEERRSAETESTDLRRFVGEIRVRTVKRDADLMNVKVLAGALDGGSFWLHLSQLPDEAPPEDRSLNNGTTENEN